MSSSIRALPDVKKSLANSEPSTLGTSRASRDVRLESAKWASIAQHDQWSMQQFPELRDPVALKALPHTNPQRFNELQRHYQHTVLL
jgi:hypothetical protein